MSKTHPDSDTWLKPFWISWYDQHYGDWELASPWWVSGERCGDDAKTICAAVKAASADDAMQVVLDAHDEHKENLEWRFVTEKPKGWLPFGDRFRRADWMEWADG